MNLTTTHNSKTATKMHHIHQHKHALRGLSAQSKGCHAPFQPHSSVHAHPAHQRRHQQHTSHHPTTHRRSALSRGSPVSTQVVTRGRAISTEPSNTRMVQPTPQGDRMEWFYSEAGKRGVCGVCVWTHGCSRALSSAVPATPWCVCLHRHTRLRRGNGA